MFPNFFMTTPMAYQPNVPMMQEASLPKVEGDLSKQVNHRFLKLLLLWICEDVGAAEEYIEDL